MNKILIVDAFADTRIMSVLLTRAGYDPVVAESIEAGSTRSGNESFLTYFRFPSSHTTVQAVPHTAVPQPFGKADAL